MTAPTLTHAFVSTVAEDPGSGIAGGPVGPVEWNAQHTLTQAGQTLLGRGAATSGSTEQISLVNDTNVTATLSAGTLTLGWSGTLGAARLNANVVQGVTSDINVTGSIAAQNLTLGWSGTLALSRLAQGTTGQILAAQSSAASIYTSSPTISTSVTTPLIIGGTGAGDTLTLESTSGAGTTDLIQFRTGAQVERLRIDSNGYITTGGTANIAVQGNATYFQGNTTNASPWMFGFLQWGAGAGPVPSAYQGKSRGGSPGVRGLVQNGDNLLWYSGVGDDGANFQEAARFMVHADGAPALNSMPGRFSVWTTPSGSVNPVERLRIDSVGSVRFSAYGAGVLHSDASGNLTSSGVTSSDISGPLSVSVGGTGVGTFTSNGVLYGNGTSAVQVTAQGAANSVLTANAGAPSFSASPTIGTSVTTPLVIGGAAASSTLTLESTSGAGTTDAIIFKTGSQVECGRFETHGALVLGATAESGQGSTGIGVFEVHKVGATYLSTFRWDANANAPRFAMWKCRSGTVNTMTGGALSSGDTVGEIYFAGADATATPLFEDVAYIRALVDAAPTAGSVPGRLSLWTSASGNSTATERLRIDSSGRVSIGAGAPTHLLDLLTAGTSSVAPIRIASGTNLTAAAAGCVEFDGTSFYATSVASARQVVDTEQVQVLSGNRTFTNNTSAQAIFNATANGAITLAATTTYEFEMVAAVSGLSSSAHTINLGFGGTATFTGIHYYYDAQTGSTLAGPTASNTGWVAAATATAICASTTTTGLVLYVRGVMRINAGGTVIPQLTQVTASAAAVVQADSFFRCWPVGSNTVTNVGNWS